MDITLDNLLCQRYTRLFKDRHANPRASCMCWGFECQNGWFVLLDTACALIVEDSPEAYATQIKEKFGELRFYIAYASDFAYGVISMAEAMSSYVCEDCGKPGHTVNDGGWFRTVCATHAKHGASCDDHNDILNQNLFNIDIQAMPIGLAWKRLLSQLMHLLTVEINAERMPMIEFDAISIFENKLDFLWLGGDEKARGMMFFVSALSVRMNPETGELISGIDV